MSIVEGMDEGLFSTREKILKAIFKHIKTQVDPDMTRGEFNEAYAALRHNLVFPLKIYRALSFGDDLNYDAHRDGIEDIRDEDEREALVAAIANIRFDAIGTSWTFNKASALSGGALGGGGGNHDGAHVILEATIGARQCDMLTTLYQNLTVYQEEQEVRLWANTPVVIDAIYPDTGLSLPMKGNTGPETYDTRDAIVRDLTYAVTGVLNPRG